MNSNAGGPTQAVGIEIVGLSIHTHHGVTEAEREVGQRLVVDISLDPGACGALESDRVEDTVDYAEVAQLVTEIATERSYRTLERLCQVICERLAERYECESAIVRAAKPEPPFEHSVEEVAVELMWSRGE